jgi:LPXTG-motif cell wall-anchored protein
MRLITVQQVVAAGLATTVLAAAPALARSADRVDRFDSPTSSLAGTVSPHQDLRGEQALEAARLAVTRANVYVPPASVTPPASVEHPVPTRPTRKAPWKVVSAPKTGGNDDSIWLILGVGLGAAGLAAGSTTVAFTRRARRAIA